MRIELWIFLITLFLMYNAYHDGKYTKSLMAYKKYYMIAIYGLLGLGIILMFRRNPGECKTMLSQANNVIKYLPIDKSSINMVSPILDFTSQSQHNNTGENNQDGSVQNLLSAFNNSNYLGEKRILESGKKSTKRSVSETKKKFVASQQNWKCGHCKSQLTAWFEVDHVKRLEYGGTNEVNNLVALCRECHGKKTAMENM